MRCHSEFVEICALQKELILEIKDQKYKTSPIPIEIEYEGRIIKEQEYL